MTAPPLLRARSTPGITGGEWLACAIEMAAVASGNWPLSPHPDPRGWTCFPRVATRTLGVDARSVRAARAFTIATVQRWGAAERSDDIATVASELLTNAVRHALPGHTRPCWRIRLGLLQPGPCVVCAVADPSHQAPAARAPGDLAETGRGLQVIGALSDTWGYTIPAGQGKVVWATFRTPSAAPLPTSARRPAPRVRPPARADGAA